MNIPRTQNFRLSTILLLVALCGALPLFAADFPICHDDFTSLDFTAASWEAGGKSGEVRIKFASGAIYEGQWDGRELSGRGKLLHHRDWSYIGEWRENKPDGQGLATHDQEPNSYSGAWSKGRRHGKGLEFDEEGFEISGTWKNGVLDKDLPSRVRFALCDELLHATLSRKGKL